MPSKYQTLYEALNRIASHSDIDAAQIAQAALEEIKNASPSFSDPSHAAALNAAEQQARKDCRSVGRSFSMFDRGLIRSAAVTALYTFIHGEQNNGQG